MLCVADTVCTGWQVMKILPLFLFALVTGCASTESDRIIPQPKDAFSGKNTPVVFEGVVRERLEPPGHWSGAFAAWQGVRYHVDLVVSGPMELGDVIVYHAVVGPPLCEPDKPELSRSIFRVGQKLRVKAERTPAGDFVVWEQAENVRIIQ